MADRNGRPGPPIHAGSVPIIGAARVHMLCSRGHVEELAGPFSMIIPGPTPGGGQDLRVDMCRVCWLNFVGMFGARAMTPEELAEFKAAQAADAPAVS